MSGILRLDQTAQLFHGGVEMGEAWHNGVKVWSKSLWSPADEIPNGKYAREGLANDFTGTALPDHNGGPITLTQSGTGPTLIADAGDGMAALRCSVDNASQRLSFDNALNLGAESLFLLIKPTAASSAFSALLAMGDPVSGNSTFQMDAAAAGNVPPNLNGNSAVPDINGVTNRIGTWITAVVELDPANSQARYWINGSQIGSGAYAPAGGTISVSRFDLFSNRGRNYSCRADFAHGFVLHEVGAAVRSKGVGYLKRLWGARVVGW